MAVGSGNRQRKLSCEGGVTLRSRSMTFREAGFTPVGHGSAANPMLVDGRGKSVRVAWSNNAADKRIVDDLIAYLLSL